MSVSTAFDINFQALPVLAWNFAAAQSVAIGASSAASQVIAAEAARLCATVDCWVSLGTNPTATVGAGSVYLPANRELLMAGTAGLKVAVIQVSGAGNLSILPAKTV